MCACAAESRDLRSGVRAADAVNMMNRLKQMTRDVRRGQAMDVRVVAAMEMCAELTLGSVRFLSWIFIFACAKLGCFH